MAYQTFIGLRYLKTRGRSASISTITLISIFGVTLGVATLCVVFSVINGFHAQLLNKVIGNNSHAILMRRGVDFSDHEDIRQKALAVPGVRSVAPMVHGGAMIAVGNRMVGVGLRGISLTHKQHLVPLQKARVGKKGNLQDLKPRYPGDLPGIALGRDLAAQLQVKQGDTVNIISPVTLFHSNYRQRANNQTFQVRYIYKFGMYRYDSKFCYISLYQAQKFLNLGKSVYGLEILLRDLKQVGTVKQKILESVTGSKTIHWPYYIRDWREMQKNLFEAIQQNKLVLGLILFFIILVSSFNIAGTLILMVIEKSKDIAILRTMGASRRDIMKIFITYGLYIGSLGTMLGVGLGLFLCQLADRIEIKLDASVYFISKLPVEIRPVEFLLVALTSILISFFAAVYPAIQASRQNPVEVLRYE